MATATETKPARLTPAQYMRGGAVAVLGLAFLIKVGALALGDHAVRSGDPTLIGSAALLSPAAAATAAQTRMAEGDVEAAEALARQAISQTPLSTRALRTFGLAREAQGDVEGAAAAMSLVGGLGWRDTPAQVWLLNAYAAQGDYAAALERADALARRRARYADMMAVFMAAAANPAARPALASRLAADPPWRQSFFETAHKIPPEGFEPYRDFLTAFTAAGHKLSPVEVEPIAANLFRQGEYAGARDLWARFAAPEGSTRNLLFDGGFDTASLDRNRHIPPFEWKFRQAPGSETGLRTPPGRGGTALYAGSPGNIRFEMAEQSLALAPGRYTLSLDAMAEPGARLEGFSWTIECLPGDHAPVIDESSSAGESGWSRLSYAFAVPSSGCGAQRLRLILHGLQPRPLALWFDDLVLAAAR